VAFGARGECLSGIGGSLQETLQKRPTQARQTLVVFVYEHGLVRSIPVSPGSAKRNALPPPGRGLDPDPAPVRLDDPPTHRQPDARRRRRRARPGEDSTVPPGRT
jgi:hypothetical protein